MRTIHRRAPAAGYDFKAKDQYRKAVWHEIRRHRKRSKLRGVMLMPSCEGLEVDLALRYGIPPQELHVVDRNPAIVASLKRRYSSIHTYGVDVFEAVKRIHRAGFSLACYSFDMCSPCSYDLMSNMEGIAEFLPPKCLVVTNVLRGREKHGENWMGGHIEGAPDFATYHGDWRDDAVKMAFAAGRRWAVQIKAGTYRSTAGTQTFRWSVWEIRCVEILPCGGPRELYEKLCKSSARVLMEARQFGRPS